MTNPTPFTQIERDELRAYFGYPKLFSSSNSVFENILNTIDGLYDSDGGACQTAIRVQITNIQNVESQLANLQNLMLSSEISGTIKINAIKNDMWLRKVVGPNFINKIAVRLSIFPAQRYFDVVPISESGQAVVHKLD